MQGFFSAPISQNISSTPEGYLICHNVPLARTGAQQYRKGELPDKDAALWPDLADDGVVQAWKTKEELFHPDTIASYNGKPITDEHPPNLFDASEHDEYDCGHVLNPRAGDEPGEDGEWYMYGDLMLTDPDLIAKVRGGYMRQVSCASTNDFVRRDDGDAEQTQIRGNHVAVVPKGRAGPLAGIRDHEKSFHMESKSMADTLRNLLGLGLKEHAKNAQPEELAGLLTLNLNTAQRGTKDADEDNTTEVTTLKNRIANLEAQLAEMEKKLGPKDDDDPSGTEDEMPAELKKKMEKDDEGSKDAEIALPEEDQPKDPLKVISAAGSMDAILAAKPAAIRSGKYSVVRAWNEKYSSLRKTGTSDSYAQFGKAAAENNKAADTRQELANKAQAAYDAARRGTR